jgi:multidrug resistance efflux pump
MDNKLTEYVLKHSKSKDKELKYDFMPSLLEIIERPAHKAGTVIIVGVFTLLIAFVVWACFSKIDVVVTAGGSVQPSGNVNVVQAYSGGTVKSINAAEGEYVKKGDVLIELDTESLDIDTNQLSSQKEILEAQRKIYTKIKNGDDISKVKIEDYEAELKPYIQSILDADASYNNTLDSLKKDKENADLNHQISQLQLEEYEESGTIRQAEMQELIVKQNELALKQSETKIKDTKTQYSAQINSKLSEISGQLDEIETNLEKYALSKDVNQCQ